VAKEADAGFGALKVDVVVEFELDCLLAVDCEVDLVRDTYDLDADGGVARDDDGANGEQVGTDGGDQHGVDAGHDNGAIRGEVVCRRTGGSGDDDAVGAEGGDELLVDLDGEVAHAGDGSLGDDDVVEGVPLADGDAVPDEAGVHHRAGIDLGDTVDPVFKRDVEVGERGFSEEAEGAEIYRQNRRSGEREDAGRVEECAVAAEHDDQAGRVRGKVSAVDSLLVQVGGGVDIEQRFVVVSAEPVDELGQQRGDLGLLRLRDDGGGEHWYPV